MSEREQELVEALEQIRDMPIPKSDVIAGAESWQMVQIAYNALDKREENDDV